MGKLRGRENSDKDGIKHLPVFLQNELSGFPLVWVDEGDGGTLKAEPERKKKKVACHQGTQVGATLRHTSHPLGWP